MKPRHIAMGGALALAAGLVVFGDTTPDNTLAEPAERVATVSSTAPARSTAVAVAKPVGLVDQDDDEWLLSALASSALKPTFIAPGARLAFVPKTLSRKLC